MKKIYKDKIINIKDTDTFDNIFQFDYLDWDMSENIEVIFMSEELEKRKNIEILEKVKQKPAMWGNVYSPDDELEIFEDIFESALKTQKKTHIVWITLQEEVAILEKYYEKLWFLREDINCFDPDFGVPMVTASVCVENLMWKGSDYKKMWKKIFFNPPVRESGQTKAMFKGINRWVTAGIYMKSFDKNIEEFLWGCVREERILPITLGKVLKYNLDKVWLKWENKILEIQY